MVKQHDDVLGELVGKHREGLLTVLDLGCGAGGYLAAQRDSFRGAPIRWVGVDTSSAMLDRARQAAPDAELIRASAENLPLDTASVDYVIAQFALHYFEDKSRALDEISRVLTPDGTTRITNYAPSYMPGWWLYRFFPGTWPVDQERFWPPQRVFNELALRGFRPDLWVEYRLKYLPIRRILADVERREISELRILDDDAYARGLASMKRHAETNPNEVGPSEIAVADVVATRGEALSLGHWP